MLEGMEFYTCLVEWSDGPTSYLRVFWAWASHLGEALHKIIECAEAAGVNNPVASEADLYEFNNLPESAITEDKGDTYKADTIHSFPTEYAYRLPYGVIQSCTTGDLEASEIVVGYELDDKEELIQVSAVVEENDLLDMYLELMTALHDIQVFWIKIHDDWEDAGKEQMYVNKELNSREKIGDFIVRNKVNTLVNGHVTVTTYSKEGATNLNISDHKTIVVLTYERELAERICQSLSNRGITARDKLITIEYGFHHWHYRHPKALDRCGFVRLLQDQGFSYWEPADSS